MTWRNGHCDRSLDTLNLMVPELRQGSFPTGFPEARKTFEQALVAVIQEAWIRGASPRKIKDPPPDIGLPSNRDRGGAGYWAVGHLEGQAVEAVQGRSDGTPLVWVNMANDKRAGAFVNRPFKGNRPYVWLDALCLTQRKGCWIARPCATEDPYRPSPGFVPPLGWISLRR